MGEERDGTHHSWPCSTERAGGDDEEQQVRKCAQAKQQHCKKSKNVTHGSGT